MSDTITDLISGWNGKAVVTAYDPPTATWMFIALHDDTLGTPTGGCRMKVYDEPADGLLDAMRLAEGMTYKWAAIDLEVGGGKSVLAIPRPLDGDERDGLLRRFGALLNSLNRSFQTGEDLGTTPEDMKLLASVTDCMMGVPADGTPADPGPYTARGVLEGMRAAVRHVFGNDDLSGRTVLVQGVGDVGEPLARMIRDAGGEVLLADVDRDRVSSLAAEVGGTVIDGDLVYDTPCDVYCPCAIGATLNASTIPRLRCRIVAGSANNQLEGPEDADRLFERDIVYAPDYVINAGGALAFGLMAEGILDREVLMARVAGIGRSIAGILEDARAAGVTPVEASMRKIRRKLDAGA